VTSNGAVEVTPAASQEVEAGARSIEWSRPTGKSFVYISADGSHLLKRTSRGLDERNISFLRRHDQVAYHPAGTHIAVSGLSLDDPPVYGLWLATNLGQDVRPLVRGESVNRIGSFALFHDGTVAFTADHGDHWDVHLASASDVGTIATGPGPYGRIVASEFKAGLFAYQEGSCDKGFKTRISGVPESLNGVVGSGSTAPAGWLPDGSLLLIARPSGCAGAGDLLRWSAGHTTVIARNVTDAAVRSVAPPPPDPPVPNEGAT
jgi:hypothetical protein